MAANGSSSFSSTMVLDALKLDDMYTPSRDQILLDSSLNASSRSSGKAPNIESRRLEEDDRNDVLPSPTTAVETIETWRSPAINMYRIASCFWAFLVLGMNDACVGAIIPYLEDYYHLSYTVISLVFLSPFVGYSISAMLNNSMHMRIGRRGIAILGPAFHILAYIIIAFHPPFPVLVICYCFAGFANGVMDAAFNAWIGVMANANEVLGFLHAFYGLGATISPLIATTMITKAGLPWYYWYYVMIGAAFLELCALTRAFWSASATQYREENPRTSSSSGSRFEEAVLQAPAARVTWLAAVFLLLYVGVEVALGGWIVTFMLDVRHGAAFASGMTATGFWLGITVGRMVLGFVTPRIGEKLAISIYLPITMGFELLFWLVPQFYVSAVAVAFQGFFLGPLFPAAVVACTKILPKHLHVSAIGFAAAFGGSGGAIFPYAVGAIAQAKGVQVLQPIILALLAGSLGAWMLLPRIEKRRD